MMWNWDFIRGNKAAIPNRPRPTDQKLIMVNDHTHEIQGSDLTDMEVAGQVRMLHRNQLNHESVCTLARDRIVYLADRIGKIEAITEDDIGRAIYEVEIRWMAASFPDGHVFQKYDELDARDRRLHADFGKAVLALISAGPAPDPVEAQEPVLESAGTAT